jgi:MOSC domain-containing protein YiiM
MKSGDNNMSKILAICTSKKKGTEKHEMQEAEFRVDHGIVGDAHAGNWHRQVSLLSFEKIEDFRRKGGKVDFGAFGENIVVEGIDLSKLPIGTKLRLGPVLMEVTQIGKVCHDRCHIYYTVGDCIMPREGIFAKVLEGGRVKVGEIIQVIEEK